MLRVRFLVLCCCLVTAVGSTTATVAFAKGGVYAPPGNSGISQYVEVVPSAGGGRPSGSVTATPPAGAVSAGAGVSTESTIPSKVQRQLKASGAAGKATAVLAAATATPVPRPGTTTDNLKVPSASSVSQLLSTLGGSGDSGGMGVLLPVILIGSLLGISLFGLLKRRRSGS